MRRALTYSDAAKLLGGQDSQLVRALDVVTGGAMLAAAIPFPAVLAWFDARGEFARLSRELLGGLSEKRNGTSRHGRTKALEAAHAVIVITAFFEAFEEAELPFRFTDLELTAAEQVAIAGGGSVQPGGTVIPHGVLSVSSLLPGPQYSYESLLDMLHDYYVDVSRGFRAFIEGLALWDRLPGRERDLFARIMTGVPERACVRYEELYRRLGADFPEVAFWSGLRDHQATRVEVREVAAALTELGELLTRISSGRVPDEQRAGLARANRACLERPIVQTGDAPPGLRVPTLSEAYVTPLFRVTDVEADARPSDESWWESVSVRDDLEQFLVGHLTGPRAVQAPLLVLGQPGSGKSVLTAVLAARLPAPDFLPVRVILRDVPATGTLQDQIEYAIRDATGERMDWPALARSADEALPVILLDGFDELLQATGASQSDYLARVSDFQRREADQGRPVAVVVTSRTSVADRARAPEGTLAVRLEPFDDSRITAWLETWNSVNADYFARHKIGPLTPATVLQHRDLAGQPLLLLMLALYDADGNALQRLNADLRRDELYERLLRSFAYREVGRYRLGSSKAELNRAVEEELKRLSLVAFGMFTRRSQWVTEADLTADLLTIMVEPHAASPYDMRTPLRPAELVLGRFFFIHRARALRDDVRLEAYEFLHATFGEFLAARLTWLVLRDMAAREATPTLSLTATPLDDDLLYALLSYAALSVRAPIIGFLVDLMSSLPDAERLAIRDLLLRLFRVVHQPRPPRKLADYGPPGRSVLLRHAAYSANLLLLAVTAARQLRISELYGPQHPEPVAAWKREALLWRSQLQWEEWRSLAECLALERRYDHGLRDLILCIDDGSFDAPPVDLHWTFEISPGAPERSAWVTTPTTMSAETVRRRTHFLCRTSDDLIQHTMEPALALNSATTTLITLVPGMKVSAARALLDLLLLPPESIPSGEREWYYRECAQAATDSTLSWTDETRTRYVALLLDGLGVDEVVSPSVVTQILTTVMEPASEINIQSVGAPLIRCTLRFLGRDARSDLRLLGILRKAIDFLGHRGSKDLVAEAEVCIAEICAVRHAPENQEEVDNLMMSFDRLERLVRDAKRSDLVVRVQRLRTLS